MILKEYNRNAAVGYAKKWATSRNEKYYDFENLGGDCTNFASQCIFAGSGEMNFEPNGWFYISSYKRSPSWTSVEDLYKFLLRNKKNSGPIAIETTMENMLLGDIVQIKANETYTHSLVISEIEELSAFGIKVCAHTYDALNRRLSTYSLKDARFLHITGFFK